MMRYVVLLLSLASASPAVSQVIQPPPRSTGGLFGGDRPLDPNRTSQDLTLTMHALGGYDSIAPDDSVWGYGTTGAGILNYRRGRANRFLDVSGRGYATSYAVLDVGPLVGGDVDVRTTASVGRRHRLTTNLGLHFQPSFLLTSSGYVGASGGVDAAPDYSATQGVTEQIWLSRSASLAFQREWNNRHQSTLQGSFFGLTLRSTDGLDAESQNRTARLHHRWGFRRNGTLSFSYRFSDAPTVDEGQIDWSVQTQTADLGLSIQKRWSPTRRLEISGGGGASRARLLAPSRVGAFVFVTPAAFGTLRLDLFRTWALSADVRREVSVLHGLVPEPFITESASLTTGGRISSRSDIAMNAHFTRGIASDHGVGAFEAVNLNGQVRWAFTRWSEIVANYTYYKHLMLDVSRLLSGYPARFDRNSVRIGLTFLLPLYGSYPRN
jgi:hypothetical protein